MVQKAICYTKKCYFCIMDKKIKEYLQKNEWISLSTLARNAKIHAKGLTNFVNGTRELPKKHVQPLHDYLLANSYSVFIGEIPKSEVQPNEIKGEEPIKSDTISNESTKKANEIVNETSEETSKEIPAWLKKLNEQVKERENTQNESDSEEAEDDFIDKSLTPEQWIQWRNECFSADEHIGWRKALDRTQHLTDKIKKEILATGIV